METDNQSLPQSRRGNPCPDFRRYLKTPSCHRDSLVPEYCLRKSAAKVEDPKGFRRQKYQPHSLIGYATQHSSGVRVVILTLGYAKRPKELAVMRALITL